jgi:fructose-1,6-bisphosphatase II / sedoheptulose-1,7-bisphosphatase
MVSGDVIFCASGITDGDLVKGIVVSNNEFKVNTLAFHKSQNIKKNIVNTYKK